jgi:hypothetical protein
MNIGAVIGGGFRLIREKPAAVAVWSFLYLLALIAMVFLMRPLMLAQMQAPVADPQVALANVGALFGRLLLFFLLFIILYVILFAAAQRAVLQPERQAFFYLRLGMDELRLFALTIILFVGFYIAVVLVAVVLGILIGLLAAATRSVGIATGVAIVEFIAIFLFWVWFSTRLALAFPLTLLRGKIIIGESWRVTRGRFWPLFAAFLVVFLILMLLFSIVSVFTSGAYFAQLAHSGMDPAAVQQAAREQMARQYGFSATMVIGWILGGIVGGLAVAIWGGAVATAARELTFNPNEIAETFA